MTEFNNFDIAIVGVGPRGAYALERLVSRLRDRQLSATIALIEPKELGAGVVYRTDQAPYLFLNTIASQVTAFCDNSVSGVDGFRFVGPDLGSWLSENEKKIDESGYPTRAQHGEYLRTFVETILNSAPSYLKIIHLPYKAVDAVMFPTSYRIDLSSGGFINARKVLFTIGSCRAGEENLPDFHSRTSVHAAPYPVERFAELADQKETVGIQGLGLTTIDLIMALTVGKGGEFRRSNGDTLEYIRSGCEPKIVAWSRSGVPLNARAVNEKGTDGQWRGRIFTEDFVRSKMANFGKLDFQKVLLPALLCEMQAAYYESLKGADFAGALVQSYGDSEDWELLLSSIPEAERFNWEKMIYPLGKVQQFNDNRNFLDQLMLFLKYDLREAKRGNITSPIKAACDVLRDVRDTLRFAVEFYALTPSSHRYFNSEFISINNRLAVGPPLFRNEQLIALVECGLLDLSLGPNPRLTTENERVVVSSTTFEVPHKISLDHLILGRVPIEYSEVVERLILRNIVRRSYNKDYQMDSIDVTRLGQVVDKFGKINDDISILGAVTEGTVWYTQVAARPRVNSRALRDADMWARRTVSSLAAE